MGSNNHAVRLLSVADRDLQELISYLAAENPDAVAKRPIGSETQLQGLQRHPFLVRTPNDPKLARLGYRVLAIHNYLALYKVKEKTVLIHRVLHGARDFVRLLMN